MENVQCNKCGESVPKTDTWIEIDPCTGKSVRVCNGCYVAQQTKHADVLMSVHFTERMCTLDMLCMAPNVYAYRVTYHLFGDHVRNETDYNDYDMIWIRDAFGNMNTYYDSLCIRATETYMDCDTCNQ